MICLIKKINYTIVVYYRNMEIKTIGFKQNTSNKKIMRIACHHGDYNHQNNLEHAKRVLELYHDQIDIMEIDFVYYQNNFVSSHDHDTDSIIKGSYLKTWIDLVIIKYHKILWLDIKVNIFSFALMITGYKHECERLFQLFKTYNRSLYEERKIDIKQYILISCQYTPYKDELLRLNSKLRRPWLFTTDLPYYNHYIWRYVLPNDIQTLNNEKVQEMILEYDFSSQYYISIDLFFFNNDIEFLFELLHKNGTLEKGSYIILYPFNHNSPIKVTSNKYNIVIMYDFYIK